MLNNVLFAVIITALTVLQINAQTPEQKGKSIAAKAIKADEGFVSSEVNLKMILTNRQGQKSDAGDGRALRCV